MFGSRQAVDLAQITYFAALLLLVTVSVSVFSSCRKRFINHVVGFVAFQSVHVTLRLKPL